MNGGAQPDANFQDGEFIVHYCPPQPASSTPAPAISHDFDAPVAAPTKSRSSGGGFFMPWLLGGFLLLAIGIGAYVYSQQQGDSKGSSSRRSQRQVYAGADQDYDYGGGYDNYDQGDDAKPLMNSPQTPDTFSSADYGGGRQQGPPGGGYGQRPPQGQQQQQSFNRAAQGQSS